jgi:predicted outer membrane protein
MRNVFGWSVVLSGCLAGIAMSQNVPKERPGAPARPGGAAAQPERGERPQPGGPAERGAAAAGDQQIAACIYMGCHNHIQIAEFAQSKLTNPEAKQFAEKMVSDHSPGCQKMREMAGNLISARGHEAGDRAAPDRAPPPGATPPGRPGGRTDDGARAEPAADTPAEARREERQDRREDRREAVRDAASKGVEIDVQPGGRPGVAVRAGAGAEGELNWISIHREIADKCLSTVKKEMGEIQGANFDEAYMAHEVMVHLKTIDELSVLKNHASPTLRAEIDKSLQMAQQHLREAKQIKTQLKDVEDEPRLSRQPGKSTTPSTTPRAVPKKDE